MGQTSGSYLKSMKQSKIGSKDETIEQLGLIQQMLVAKTETVAKKLRDDAIEDKRFPVKAVVKTVGKQLISPLETRRLLKKSECTYVRSVVLSLSMV